MEVKCTWVSFGKLCSLQGGQVEMRLVEKQQSPRSGLVSFFFSLPSPKTTTQGATINSEMLDLAGRECLKFHGGQLVKRRRVCRPL